MQIVLNALMAVERVTWTQKEVETLSWSYDVVSLEVSAPRNVRKQEKLKSAIHGRDGLGWVRMGRVCQFIAFDGELPRVARKRYAKVRL